eukprot:superscaffoldBa00007950_g22961
MFVPLPVPFVFQRTAPDLNAWRLKSPLALRSSSGKTFFSSPCYTSSMSARHSHADPPRLARCRCTCSGGELSAHTPTYTRTHTPPAPFDGLNGVLYTCGTVVKTSEAFPSALECPD